jgi:hypothetical protein
MDFLGCERFFANQRVVDSGFQSMGAHIKSAVDEKGMGFDARKFFGKWVLWGGDLISHESECVGVSAELGKAVNRLFMTFRKG